MMGVPVVNLSEFLDERLSSEEENEVNTPNILLIDLSNETYDELKSKGFNVSKGSFGSPYSVYKSDKYNFVKGEADLPVISEQDVVIIDLVKKPINSNEIKYEDPGNIKKLFQSSENGIIDIRPNSMDIYLEKFDRIFENGRFFVIFAESLFEEDYILGKSDKYGKINGDHITYNNWSFLSILNNLFVINNQGKEINIKHDVSPFNEFFKKHLGNSKYNCVFEYVVDDEFLTLLENRFDESVGCLISINDSEKQGHILILPDMPRTPELILDLLNEVLPSLSPNLFPNVKGKWIEEDEYEFKYIKDLKNQIEEIAIEAKTKIEKIEEDISSERREYGFLHGILTGTGDELVDDVQKCLKFIGFNNVVDADEFVKEGEDKEEDLQIFDNEVKLLVEVKGPSTKTKNTYVNQISNYVSRRRKEWKTFDLDGVLIINHQRNIPPLKRDNTTVFTRNQINDAERDDICLITTWELFLLIRGLIKYNWNPKVIRDLFYQSGRISAIPSNYEPIGQIFTTIKDKGVIGIEINKGDLSKGQMIGYIISNEFFEENVESLQIDNKDIGNATVGDKVGITSKFINNLKEGLTVYKII